MSNFAERIAALSPEKRELLLQQLNKNRKNASQTQIKPHRDSNTFPLSFAQQRLWFLNQLEPGSPSYNLPKAVRLTGSLNLAALEHSFNEIIRRHQVLRTTFAYADGQPIQLISPDLTLTLPVINLSEWSQAEREAEVRRLALEKSQQPFDLTQGPLLRITLLRLSEEEHVVLLTMHHIVSDAWSTGVLIRELAALYDAFSQGNPSRLPELPIQYVDFAYWQRQWLQGEILESQLAYWKQHLGGNLPMLQLPTDRSRPAFQVSPGATQSFELSPTLSQALKVLSQREGVTLFMTLLAAFKTLLYRYSGQEDILVGSPIANRNRVETESLIGFFVNTLVLRTDLSGNPSFKRVLRRVREVALGAYTYQDLPFEKLVEELQPERNLSHTPLFQVMFDLQTASMSALELLGLKLRPIEADSITAKFDLTLSMVDKEQGLVGSLEYNTDLFNADTIARMLGHFQTLLEGIVANPEQPIPALPLLTQAELHQLLVEFNQYRSKNCKRRYTQIHADEFDTICQISAVHELFEAQVERSPNAVAVVFEDEQLTYRQLNQRANKIAHYLRNLGAGPDVLVGVCMERSLEMVVGLLGILKAGGAYVPLDPAYPKERLAFMLADAQVPVLLTQQRLTHIIPPQAAKIVCLDADWELIAQESEENPLTNVTAENLVYVIYTSGSTGKSKGVMIQHRSLVNAYLAWEETYQLRFTPTCHLQMASFSFDVFSGDLVRALCSGGKLVLCRRELLLEAQKLYALMLEEKVDCADFVPAVLRNLIQYLEQSKQRLDFMRLLVCGSDSWYVSEYKKFRHLCGHETRLINSFGLSEATIDSSYFESAVVDLPVEQLVPIGRPFANTQFYILDPHLQPLPIGVPGELYVGGAGLARGYCNRPELTAEKFIPNPFSNELGARLYKTGDWARYLHDGNIEFLGRIDHQVKLRGFRIELGEIEAVLTQHPAVREAVVLVREDQPGNKRLVAYVVPYQEMGRWEAKRTRAQGHKGDKETRAQGYKETRAQGHKGDKGETTFVSSLSPHPPIPPSPHPLLPLPLCTSAPLPSSAPVLRSFLKEKLPNYMVPHAFVLLEALPLTPNGKVDRRVLPAPDSICSELEGTSVAPSTAIEEILAGIWTQVLGVEQVGIHDNFFELGGDSILSIQVIAKANQVDLRLTPKQLFEHQTIAELAAVVDTAPTIQAEQGAIAGSVPLTPIQRWFFEQNLPEPHYWNQSILLEVRQPINFVLLDKAVQQLLVHHDALRLRFVQANSQWQQLNAAPSEAVLFTRLDFSALPETEQGQAIEAAAAELQSSLNLSQGPILRVGLFDLGRQQPSRLLIVIHHLVVDGLSWRILLEDLHTAYQQLSQGESVHFPPKSTSFKQWSYRMIDYAQSAELQQELSYWLADPRKQISCLPVDYSGGTNTVASASIVSVELGAEETRALLQEVPAVYRTQINDVLLTALVQAFAQWTGARSLLVDLEGHGREEIFADVEVSRTVGWFTSVFPVLLTLDPGVGDLGDALKTVKEQLRSIPNRGIGYGVLRYLSSNREIALALQALPQAEVSFNYLGQFDQNLSGSSLFGLAQESSGPARSPQGSRSHLLEINGFITGGQLHLDWTYSENLHRRATIDNLAQGFLAALRSLIAHCQSPEAGGYTPSDFPLAQLSQNDLESAFAMVEF